MRRLLNTPFLYYISKYRLRFLLGVSALVLTNSLDVLSPYIIGTLLNNFEAQGNLKGSTSLFALLIAASLGTALFRYCWRVWFAGFHHRVARDLRTQIFKGFQRTPYLDFLGSSTGDKMSLLSKDVENFRMGVGPGLLILFDAILYLTLIPYAMWHLNPNWTIIVLFIAPVIPIVVAFLEKRINVLLDRQQKQLSELSGIAQENTEGIKVVKSFQLEKLRQHIYDQKSNDYRETSIKIDFIESSFSPVLEFFVTLSTSALLFIVAYRTDWAGVQVGTLFAFYQYLQRLTWPFTALGLSYMMLGEAKASFKRIKEVLKHLPEEVPQEEAKAKHAMEISGVSFSYPDGTSIVSKLEGSLNHGESLLITGRTKVGKSTIVKLITGLLAPQDGEIKINHESMRYNPQIPFLFMDTLKDNLTLGTSSDLNKEDFRGIAFEDELSDLPDKELTKIGEKGASLSGGQKQRLCLLRALKSNAAVLVLDEPISAVDERTKTTLVETLKDFSRSGKTLIVATTSPQYFKWMDKVLYIDPKDEKYSISSLQKLKNENPQLNELLNSKHQQEEVVEI